MSFQPPKKAQNVLSEWKLKLYAAPAENAVERNGRALPPSLTVSVHDNQPRFTVYTNVKDDFQDGKIEGNMDSPTFFAVMEMIIEASSNPEFQAVAVSNLGFTWGKEGKSDRPMEKSRTVVGRDANGVAYIALLAGKNRPAIRFFFQPSEWHTLMDQKSGQVLPKSKVAEYYARGYANMMKELVAGVLQSDFQTSDEIKARKEANRNNRGGGGGSGNRGGGGYNNRNGNSGGGFNGGGSSAPAADIPDEDIPW